MMNWENVEKRIAAVYERVSEADLSYTEGGMEDVISRIQRVLPKSREQIATIIKIAASLDYSLREAGHQDMISPVVVPRRR